MKTILEFIQHKHDNTNTIKIYHMTGWNPLTGKETGWYGALIEDEKTLKDIYNENLPSDKDNYEYSLDSIRKYGGAIMLEPLENEQGYHAGLWKASHTKYEYETNINISDLTSKFWKENKWYEDK